MSRLGRRAVGWWRDRPLRFRLTSAAVVVVAIAVLAVTGVAYVVVRDQLISTLDARLTRTANDVADALHGRDDDDVARLLRPGLGRHSDDFVQLVPATGPPLRPDEQVALPVSAADRRVARLGQPMLRTVEGHDDQLRMATVPAGSGVALQVAMSTHDLEDQLEMLTRAFALICLAALVGAGLLAWLVVRSALAPITRLTRAAERVSETRDLALRIGDQPTKDELGRLAGSFNMMLSALEESVTAQRHLVADASHELRTPLASVRANVEILRELDRLEPAEREDVLRAVLDQLDELTALVSDVVELARGSEPPQHVDEVRLDRLVDRAVDRARRHWAASFATDLEPVVVEAVGARLDRAVANLLDNAAKFSGSSGRVEVTLRSTSEGATLAIADDGPGIPDDALAHIFDRFYRADSARGMPGSGLGLAIVRQTAESLGGDVSICNRPDRGVQATLTLPVRDAARLSGSG